MEVDPIRLLKIQKSSVSKTIIKFSNLTLDYDDLMSEASLAAMLSLETFKKDKGFPFYSYVYLRTMNHLRNYVNRKVAPTIANRCGEDLVATHMYSKGSLDPKDTIEARERVNLLSESLDDKGKAILKHLENGLNHAEAGKLVGLSQQAVNKRILKMREFLLVELS